MTLMAAPISFSELSLWVRVHDNDRSIIREVSQRKLAKALTPQQEASLKSQGASDSLIQSLKSPAVIASSAEVAASEVKSQPPKMPSQSQETAPDSAPDNLHIFEVSAGHPINLSQWGGPDTEFAFNIFRYAGENIVEPAVIDTVRTYTDVATYIGPIGTVQRTALPHYRSERFIPYLGGDLKDDSYMIGDYTAAVSHSNFRGISIDRKNPVFVKGVPYTLYPIYGVRGISLYYITNSTNSVKLAVTTPGR
ncbi:MAG: hypothetical protein DLM73_17105 [Chthoniobacterales bacterium]|nr:MAG: hypothetical protein DLM73_17105 [Chthoniobacterales bacterium]